MASQSINSRIKAHEALKFLFSFEEIINKPLKSFTLADVNALKYFLHGSYPAGNTYCLQGLTYRSNSTVNGYLSVYRKYLEYLGINSHPLFSKGTAFKASARTSEDNSFIRAGKYKTNEKLPSIPVEVPKYISVEEFINILEIVRNHYTAQEEIIIRLMFQTGLRIGEVLGLTFDDVVMSKNDKGGGYTPIAYIRNRTSDKSYQHAKTCMKVESVKQYTDPAYLTEGYGYQFVALPGDLYDLINEYIETNHETIRDDRNCSDRYYKKSIADRVRPAEEYEDDNYYIFVNSIGTPLSSKTWNTTLRRIFKEAGIHIDKGKRENNLNHRFRHGFAMFHVKYLHTKQKDLADLLRHSRLESVACYYRPTVSDQIELKTNYVESMYDAIPQLRRKDN